MTRRRLTALAVPLSLVVLTGCSGEPRAQLRGDVAAITLAANDRDADAVRDEVEDLLSTIRAQIASGDLDRAEGDRLRAIALRIAENADLLAPEESPSPSPSPEDSPSPSPSPSPEESPTPEPSPSPEPSPTEDEDEEEETPPPLIEISPASSETSPSPSPAAVRSSPAAASPQPSPQSSA